MKSKIVLTIAIIAAIVAAIIVLRPSEKSSQEPKATIKIGASLPLSGDSAHIGDVNRKALEMTLEQLKNKGLKYNYELVFEDNKAIPGTTATTANKLISVDDVKAVFTIWSPMGGIVSSITGKKNVFSFACSYGTNFNKTPYSFNTISSAEDMADLAIKTFHQKGIKSVAIFIDDGSDIMTDVLRKKLLNSDINLVAYELFNIGDKDFRTSIIKVRDKNPDVYLVSGYPPFPYLFMKQLVEINGTAKNLTAYDAFTDMPADQRAEAEGLWYIDSNVNGTAKFEEDLFKSKSVEPESCSGNTATNLQIFIEAVENSKLEEGETIPSNDSIVAYINENTKNKDTYSGKVNLLDQGMIDVKPVIKIIKNGKPVIEE